MYSKKVENRLKEMQNKSEDKKNQVRLSHAPNVS